MPRPYRNSILCKRVTLMRRDNLWYASRRFYDSTKDFLACPTLRDVERMEKRRESLLDSEQETEENDHD